MLLKHLEARSLLHCGKHPPSSAARAAYLTLGTPCSGGYVPVHLDKNSVACASGPCAGISTSREARLSTLAQGGSSQIVACPLVVNGVELVLSQLH